MPLCSQVGAVQRLLVNGALVDLALNIRPEKRTINDLEHFHTWTVAFLQDFRSKDMSYGGNLPVPRKVGHIKASSSVCRQKIEVE